MGIILVVQPQSLMVGIEISTDDVWNGVIDGLMHINETIIGVNVMDDDWLLIKMYFNR